MRRAALIVTLMLSASAVPAQTSGPDGGRITTPEVEGVDPGRFGMRPADEAYGAYQRGYYLTALDLATPLALGGDAAAQTLIAEIYSRGLGVRRDLAMATEWYAKAAEQNVPEAQFQLAMILLDGGVEFRDENRAFSLMQRAADAGHRLARFNFAQMLMHRGPADRERAAHYYELSAEDGLPDAQYAMAQLYRYGTSGKPVDPVKARHWLAQAANQNYDTAQIELGTLLVESGEGVEQEKAGFAWLMRAAVAGNPAAQNRVAKLYRAGVGVEADRVTAVAWYLRARRAGLVDPLMEDLIDGLTADELDLARRRAAIL